MKRYVILVHSEATEKNLNFHRTDEGVQNYFYGRHGSALNTCYEAKVMSEDDADKLSIWMLKEYGYKTKASAMKGLKSHQETAEWETKRGWWNSTASVVEVDVPEETEQPYEVLV